MIIYLLKSTVCLTLLLGFYHLVLEREKMHRFNRFYLLGSVLFSFLAPVFIIYVEAAPFVETIPVAINNMEVQEEIISSPILESDTVDYMSYFLWLYLLISSILLIRFLKSFFTIVQKIRTNQKTKYANATVVLVNDQILPHTFWKYIFINKTSFEKHEIEEELFTHELTHVTQKHTIDVLLIEILQIVFWINPMFFLLKKAIQLNHEFLADDSVIASHKNISEYQHLLLDKAAWKNEYYLASNLNYSLTKKRLLMMKTSNSKTNIFLKKLAILPLLTGLVFLFANRVEAQSTKKVPQVIEVQKGITKSQMKEYKGLIKKAIKTKTFKFKEIERMDYLYSKMSASQKKTVQNIREVMPPPPPPKKAASPKPVKIEVIEKSSKSKKAIKQLKEVKKAKQTKALKGSKRLIEVIEIPLEEIEEEEEKIEEREVIEVKEVEEIIEEEMSIKELKELREKKSLTEIIEIPQEKEIVIYERAPLRKLEYDQLKKDGATFYLNGKKISTKKAKKYFGKKAKDVKDIEIEEKQNKAIKVDITTK